jgi:hypothetical protein
VNTSRQSLSIWGVSSIVLIAVPILCAALATLMLEALLAGREPASINTRLPGWTYASATVMKICLAGGVVAASVALVALLRRRWFSGSESARAAAPDADQEGKTNPSNHAAKSTPIWGILSVALPSFAPLIGALAVLIAQALVDGPGEAFMSYMSLISRKGVLVMLAWITASMSLGILGVLKRERPRSLSMFGVAISACLIALFVHFQFYELGFDQDRWASP